MREKYEYIETNMKRNLLMDDEQKMRKDSYSSQVERSLKQHNKQI